MIESDILIGCQLQDLAGLEGAIHGSVHLESSGGSDASSWKSGRIGHQLASTIHCPDAVMAH